MRKRHPNHRLVKIHRSYTVEEIAELYAIHKNTVRRWVKSGLALSDDKRPMLILGIDLVAFLQARRTKNKRPCKPGEIYCVRCRAPKFPAASMAEYVPVTEKFGNLVAICPDCGAIMNRRVSLARIGQMRGGMDISFPQALEHLVERAKPTVNSDLR
jgi:Helix-turn-helix domain